MESKNGGTSYVPGGRYLDLITSKYNVPNIPPTNADGKKLYLRNGKGKHTIIVGISQSELVKFIYCKSSYKMWENLN